MRTGIGFDVHGFSSNRRLILGGVEIPAEFGLEGHSDADVLLHAVIDALLGAAALGDIGQHFPDDNPKFKDISSTVLLVKTYDLIRREGFELNNLDCTVLLEAPKISPFIPQIRKKIADLFWCDRSKISVKATTTEKLGFVGRNEGAAAIAMVSIKKRRKFR